LEANDTLYELDLNTLSVTERANMPSAKNNFALARYYERIYALGGNDG